MWKTIENTNYFEAAHYNTQKGPSEMAQEMDEGVQDIHTAAQFTMICIAKADGVNLEEHLSWSSLSEALGSVLLAPLPRHSTVVKELQRFPYQKYAILADTPSDYAAALKFRDAKFGGEFSSLCHGTTTHVLYGPVLSDADIDKCRPGLSLEEIFKQAQADLDNPSPQDPQGGIPVPEELAGVIGDISKGIMFGPSFFFTPPDLDPRVKDCDDRMNVAFRRVVDRVHKLFSLGDCSVTRPVPNPQDTKVTYTATFALNTCKMDTSEQVAFKFNYCIALDPKAPFRQSVDQIARGLTARLQRIARSGYLETSKLSTEYRGVQH